MCLSVCPYVCTYVRTYVQEWVTDVRTMGLSNHWTLDCAQISDIEIFHCIPVVVFKILYGDIFHSHAKNDSKGLAHCMCVCTYIHTIISPYVTIM